MSTSSPVPRTMDTDAQLDPDARRMLDFWMALPMVSWFNPPPTLDTEIRSLFLPLVERARSNSLDHWTSSPRGTVALLILLDQFPRNLYRNSATAFFSDAKACSIATEAIAKGFDRECSLNEQLFMYLPLMHDERLLSQVASVALNEGLALRCSAGTEEEKLLSRAAEAASIHKEVILRFGRYPGRNKALGRESTKEEEEFLKEKPRGF